jgi:CRP-like cAMP-binding protein
MSELTAIAAEKRPPRDRPKTTELRCRDFFGECRAGAEDRPVEGTRGFFSQGSAADSIFYLQKGRARLTAVSPGGKEATLSFLGAGDLLERNRLLAQWDVASKQPRRLPRASPSK